MKSRVILLACWILAVTTAWIPVEAGAKEQVLKLASWGPTSHYVAVARQAWIETINEKAAGKVVIKDYPGGQLYGPGDMHRAVARGSADLGVVLQPAMLGMIPMLQGAYLPFAFDSVDEIAGAYKGESLEIIEEELKKRNLKLVYVSFLDGIQVFSNKKNLETVEDFKGLRILSASPMFSRIMNRLGAAPDTSIPQDEQYMALRRGVADANANSTVGGYFQRSHEVAPYFTKVDIGYGLILVCANLETWNKLPEDVRQLMLEEGHKAGMQTLQASKGWEQKFMGEMKNEGATVTVFPEEERDKIKKIARPVWIEWAQEHGDTAKRLLKLNLDMDVE